MAKSAETPSTSQILDELDFELHDRKGSDWTDEHKYQLLQQLRTFASKCLSPLPHYNCLADDYSTAFDDKLIVIARSASTREIVGFTSAVYLVGFEDEKVPFVLHTGLTCVAETLRQKNLTIFLFYHVFLHLISEYPEGFWLSNLAGVISSLGSITRYGTNVYPSPSLSAPSQIHRLIANAIDLHHRDKMLISPDAVFESKKFVFRGSNAPDSCFRKKRDDVRYADRQIVINDFYRTLLREGEGDEVLQVAFIDPKRILSSSVKETRFDKLHERESKL